MILPSGINFFQHPVYWITARRCLFGAVVACCITGCALQNNDISGVPLPPSEQISALERESEREYLGALSYWKKARSLVDERIAAISLNLKDISASYAARGVTLYEKRKGDKALQEFLKALRYDPDNDIALSYMKQRYRARHYNPYTIKEGDSIENIAEAVYGSPLEAYAVSLFSGVDNDKDLVAGAEIHLPLLDSFYSQGLLDYKRNLIVARKLYKEQDYDELLPLSETILKNHPGDEEASYLLNSSLVGLGRKLRDEEKYEEAVGVLSRVDPIFKNVSDDIIQIRKMQKEKLSKDALRLNTELFRKGEQLYSKRKYPEALNVFREIDPGFDGVEKAIDNVIEVMRMQADVHYKKGVKYFINDKLEAAIREWEKTLRFDPQHEKAASYIAKARKLLEKVKAIN